MYSFPNLELVCCNPDVHYHQPILYHNSIIPWYFFFLEMNLAADNKTFRQNQYNIVK